MDEKRFKRHKNKYETILKYKIYELLGGGLLKEPTDNGGYRGPSIIFDEYDSVEDACWAIQDNDDAHGDYIIIPVASKRFVI